MPVKYPDEFREDVVRVALNRETDVTLVQVAKDFGIHIGTLDKWLRAARVESGEKEGLTARECAQIRELKKRNRLLEQENEVLRRVVRTHHLSGSMGRVGAGGDNAAMESFFAPLQKNVLN